MVSGGPLHRGCPAGGAGSPRASQGLPPGCHRSWSAPGCEHVGVCDTELRQPFLHKERPRTPEPSLEGPGRECLVGNRPSPARPPPHPFLSLMRGNACPPLFLFLLSHSSLSIWGGRRTRCRSPVPRGWHTSLPPETTQEPHFHSGSQPSSRRSGHTSLHSASPRSTTAHPFPACCLHGEGVLPSSLSQPPSPRPEPFTHGPLPPGLQPPGRRLIGRK